VKEERSIIKRFALKRIVLLILLILLIPAVLTLTTFFLSNEIENALSERSRILYSGPEDLRTFITRDKSFEIINDVFDNEINISGSSADIVLEIVENNANVNFSSENISSIIAYERLSKLLSQYVELSAKGGTVELYFVAGEPEQKREINTFQFTLNTFVRIWLTSIISLLTFTVLVLGNVFTVDGKKTILTIFSTSVLISFCISAFVTALLIVSANYIIPPLLPVRLEDFVLLSGSGIFNVILLSGFLLGISVDALKICADTHAANGTNGTKNSFYIPIILLLGAIFLNMTAISDKMPEWSYFIPLLNLHGLIRDVIIYGIESGRLLEVIGTNIIFIILCMVLSLRAAKGRQIIFKEKGL